MKAAKVASETHLPCSFSSLTRQTSGSVKFKDSTHGGLVLQGGYDGNRFGEGAEGRQSFSTETEGMYRCKVGELGQF